MELTIYASKKTFEKDGEVKSFYAFSTKLKNYKTDEDEFFSVKFNADCGNPKVAECPMHIIVGKEECSISKKEKSYIDKKTGEEKIFNDNVLWVNSWEKSDNPFVDTSTDDYFIKE